MVDADDDDVHDPTVLSWLNRFMTLLLSSRAAWAALLARSRDSRLVALIEASAHATRRGERMPVSTPVVDRLERILERLTVAAWRARMDDPAFAIMLDQERVERNQQLGQGECVPTTIDLDLDRCRLLTLV
jgi:hypothetical protein